MKIKYIAGFAVGIISLFIIFYLFTQQAPLNIPDVITTTSTESDLRTELVNGIAIVEVLVREGGIVKNGSEYYIDPYYWDGVTYHETFAMLCGAHNAYSNENTDVNCTIYNLNTNKKVAAIINEEYVEY